jgi:hypothetical protein
MISSSEVRNGIPFVRNVKTKYYEVMRNTFYEEYLL